MLDWLTADRPHDELAARHASGWLALHLPEVDALYGVPQTAAHHPEICTGAHIELCLEVAAELTTEFDVRFAVLTHDLGKALTPRDEWPKHVNHEHAGLTPLADVCARLEVPASAQRLARLVCEWHLHAHRAFEMGDASVVKFFMNTGMDLDAELARGYLLACESDKRGRLGRKNTDYRQGAFLRAVRTVLLEHPYPEGITMQHPAGNRIHQARVQAVKQLRASFGSPADISHC